MKMKDLYFYLRSLGLKWEFKRGKRELDRMTKELKRELL